MSVRKPYHGLRRKLVLAFDVGTTYSGVSYSVLDPWVIPTINGVTRFPAQENVGGDSKIPSILYYDQQGGLRAAGAEALQEIIIDQADDEGWTRLEWWKLHLLPKGMESWQVEDGIIPPLPPNKSVVDVLGDFMKYLYQCTRTYIQETHANGRDLWRSLEDDIDFVITHPNGWEGTQQSQIRRAMVIAGLIPDHQIGHARVQFVTEGEASLHFCLSSGLASDAMAAGTGIIVVDAGGGTIDLSAYNMLATQPPTFEEIAAAECLLQGSVRVSRRAGYFLKEKLRGSNFGNPESIAHITNCFEKTTKHRFRNPEEPSFIRFGTVRDRDPAFNIRSGRLKLLGSEVEGLFEPSAQSITDAIEKQCRTAHQTISFVFLVGGFAANYWLFSRLQTYVLPLGVQLCRPDSHANKAVADGAVSFYLDHMVTVRVARWTYGTRCLKWYNPSNPQHAARSDTIYNYLSGHQFVPKGFSAIIVKGTQVSETKEFSGAYFQERRDIADFGEIQANITCYRGSLQDPQWIDTESDMFSTLCTVTADTRQMAKTLKPCRGVDGGQYYRFDHNIILLFGLTELKAQISWMEDGEEKRCPAKVVYDLYVTAATGNT